MSDDRVFGCSRRCRRRMRSPVGKHSEVLTPFYDDPYLPLQHGLLSMQAEQSHRWASDAGVTVAVIDTGMDLQHQHLAGRVLALRNFVDRDEARFQRDIHGTAVAGVIAASANNGSGPVGIAPGATMLPLKACWQVEYAGDGTTCSSFTLVKALNVAIQSEVDVINLSLAGPRDALLERLVRTALERDVIVVGATTPAGAEQFPASVPGVIAATADVSEFSAGALAPGHKVLSARPQDNYQFFDGSSFSAAHIAGLAALVKEMEANGQPIDLLALLERTADPRTGEVSACRALASLAGEETGVCPGKPVRLSVTDQRRCAGRISCRPPGRRTGWLTDPQHLPPAIPAFQSSTSTVTFCHLIEECFRRGQ